MHVRRTLTVLADAHDLRIVDGAQVLAHHRRSYDRGAQIEQSEHVQALRNRSEPRGSIAALVHIGDEAQDDPSRETLCYNA